MNLFAECVSKCSYCWDCIIHSATDRFADVNVVKQLNTMETQAMECCPACRKPFDLGKQRRLVDTCGHVRCHSCMFNSDKCPVCSDSDRKFRKSGILP